MKRFTVLLLTAMFLVPVSLSAQGLTNKERRHINQLILNIVDEYERSSALYDSESIYTFRELFVSPDATVYCDLMGTANYQSPITLKEYIQEANDHARGNLEISILNVQKGEMAYADGYWMIPVTFQKEMSYSDENGVLFSAREYYGGQHYRITLNLRYSPEDDTCLIHSIEGRMNSAKSFPIGKFQVITHNYELSGRNKVFADRMTYQGLPLEYNSFGQAIVSADFEPEIDDPDVSIQRIVLNSNENYENVMYSFKQFKSRAKLRLGVAPIMAYTMKSPSNNIDLSRSMAFEAGVDIGTTFLAGNAKFGVYTGAAISISNAKFSQKDTVRFSSQQFFSPDGKVYSPQTVSYSVDSATESLGYKDLMIPLYFECEHPVGTSATVVWNFGVKAYMPLDTDPGTYSVKGTRTIGDQTTVIDGSYDKFIYPVSYNRSTFSLSAMANLGVDINLIKTGAFKNRLLATVKAGYEHGIMPVYTTNGAGLKYSKSNPLFVYDPTNDCDVASHSLINNITLKRQAVWLELGIKIKM